jgi:hypothetical protein
MKATEALKSRLPRRRSKQRSPEAVEDVSLAVREYVTWPVADWLLGLGEPARAALAIGAAVAIAVGCSSLLGGGSGSSSGTRAAVVAAAPESVPATVSAPAKPKPRPKPAPTLHGAAPVFKPTPEKGGKTAKFDAAATTGATSAPAAPAANTGNPATDTISSSPAAQPLDASASASTSNSSPPKGPPAGPAALAVARKFAAGFVVYETGGEAAAYRGAFLTTATPDLAKALLRRPPHQPAGVPVPKAKVLNIVPAPSRGSIYPLSVSLLRVGVTSELRLEMEQRKHQGWRVTNVLG